jgi:choline dehydrogenase
MSADFVIIGAGSAGSAMAWRLAEGGASVTVIEHGGTDAGPFIQMPAALSYPMNMARYDWGFHTEPEPHLGGRVLATPRGKVIGGSSSINGMVYVRGHARDFDTWAEMGAQGWSYADVLPYFQRMEQWHGQRDGADPSWRGAKGPLHVTRGPRDNPLFEAFIRAGEQAGYPVTRDYNGQQQEGFGPMEATIFNGQRWSAANAYLKPAIKTGKVQVIRALARRVVIEAGRAVGVEVERGRADRGDPGRARGGGGGIQHQHAQDPDAVGDRACGASARTRGGGGGGSARRGGEFAGPSGVVSAIRIQAADHAVQILEPDGQGLVIGAQWLFTKKGLGASNQFEACAFIRSKAGVEYPDIQYHFLPIAVRYDGKVAAEGHGFQAHVGPMRSKSRGAVTLRSGDPAVAPKIVFNYMSHPEDWEDFRTCIRLTREIFGQEAMASHVKHEIQPGAGVQTDAELDDFIRHHAESAYHPCGTARMGRRDDPMAVVDPECRVIGVDGLRVADSSIFPQVTNGNLNGPSIMVGEKAADHLLGRTPLPASNQEPWINPNWRVAQR